MGMDVPYYSYEDIVRLHPGVLSDACFSTIAEWKSLVADGMTEHDYSWFEWHANAFAGLVLVPRNDLREKYEQTCSMLMGYGLEPTSDACCERIAKELAQYFEVSPSGVIERRLRKENWFQD
ncbi:MAG: ImmA/IrrE family metallo-endopeptidase [Planctomycetes bacterium]|nr:ImmA/IrrE family metallo-endopeptidase [Planctomycetota bacterium]